MISSLLSQPTATAVLSPGRSRIFFFSCDELDNVPIFVAGVGMAERHGLIRVMYIKMAGIPYLSLPQHTQRNTITIQTHSLNQSLKTQTLVVCIQSLRGELLQTPTK
jgi:hypothetical protein